MTTGFWIVMPLILIAGALVLRREYPLYKAAEAKKGRDISWRDMVLPVLLSVGWLLSGVSILAWCS